MNNKNKWTIILLIFTIIVIDVSLLFGGNRLSLPIKLLILLVTSIAEFCSIFIMIKVPTPQKYKKEPFGLKAKFYSIVLFLSTILYTIGIWNVTPASPYNVKESILGVGILIQVVFFIYFLLDFLRNKIWYNSSMNYEASKQLTDVRFKRLVGVQRTTFEEMLAVLK
ncbi:hypothetical protein, partial [Streptococcus agalactiae]|uniref:hypothetical protein n=1 Tax=Streptococcus agalactiae TaxID=1311 RepID=UPI0020036AEF